MTRQLVFNGTSLETFNVFWDGSGRFVTPTKRVTFYQIPSRNGDLASWDNSFSNVEIEVDCFIRGDFETNFSALVKFLYSQNGYCRLSFDTDDDYYRLAQFVNAIVPETGAYNDYAKFTLVFNCQPQKYFKSNQSAQTSGRYPASLRKIATSNYIGVAQTLNNVPIDDLPNSKAFYIFNLGRYSYGATNTKTISITSTSPFVAVYSGWINAGYQTGHADEFDELLAYSTNGNISWTGEFSNRTYVLIPIEYVGTLTASDGSYSIDADLSPLSTASNTSALGLSMELTIGFIVYSTTATLQDYSTMVRGTLNGAQTFQSVINIDFPKLVNDLGAPTSTPSRYDVVIDSDNLDAYIYGGRYGERKINEYVSISGELSGLADSVDVFPYFASTDMFNVSFMEVTPRWWKL